jgi:hypothetical protein
MADNVNKIVEDSSDKEGIETYHKTILATRYGGET